MDGSGGVPPTSVNPVHPLTFKPEFIDAFELGTKNTLLDGALTLNGDLFYYNYENYQISQIVDRTAINLNYDAHVKGAELEATYEPAPGLRFNFSGGWEEATVAKGQSAVDLMDRTAGHAGWYVVKPFVNEASNCILPDYVVRYITEGASGVIAATSVSNCTMAYLLRPRSLHYIYPMFQIRRPPPTGLFLPTTVDHLSGIRVSILQLHQTMVKVSRRISVATNCRIARLFPFPSEPNKRFL